MKTTPTLSLMLVLSVFGINAQSNLKTAGSEQFQKNWQKSFHEGYQAALRERFHKNEKKYDIATLNQAARNRNTLLSSFGGDPYGMGTTILSGQKLSFGRKKRATHPELRGKRGITSTGTIKEAYHSGYTAGKEMVEKLLKEKNNPERRFSIEHLNHAARHRNVYFDAAGGDPYGGSSVVSSRQHVKWQHAKRSLNSEDEHKYDDKAVQRLLRRVSKIQKKEVMQMTQDKRQG